MPHNIHKPPPVIDHAQLLQYAILDESVGYSGRTLLLVNENEIGRVPCLAVCRDARSEGVLLFHCDAGWDVLGCSAHASVDLAKARAERIYPGLSALWIEARVTAEEAERYLDQLWGGERCSICARRGDQVEELHEEAGGWICERCLANRAFAEK
jgi:hypothetical protein